MSSTHLCRKEILQAFVVAFLLALGYWWRGIYGISGSFRLT